MNEIAELMVRRILKKDAAAASPAKHRTFHGYDALQWRFSSGSTIDIPTLEVTILMEPASPFAEAGLSIAEAG
jgi:hypothetical protein